MSEEMKFLDGPDRGKLLRDLLSVARRSHEALELLLGDGRFEKLCARDGARFNQSLQPCDEEESIRDVGFEGVIGGLSVRVVDPFAFVDPESDCDPLVHGPGLWLGGPWEGHELVLELGYSIKTDRWHACFECEHQPPFLFTPGSGYTDDMNRICADAAVRINEAFNRFEFPDPVESVFGSKEQKLEDIGWDRARTLVPIFYDFCKAYFDYEFADTGDDPSDTQT
jgi:hypothetical protein